MKKGGLKGEVRKNHEENKENKGKWKKKVKGNARKRMHDG
jgi:hypothetical protein